MPASYHHRRKQSAVNETYMSEMIDESVMKLAPVIHFVQENKSKVITWKIERNSLDRGGKRRIKYVQEVHVT
jgi:hypothetical protein